MWLTKLEPTFKDGRKVVLWFKQPYKIMTKEQRQEWCNTIYERTQEMYKGQVNGYACTFNAINPDVVIPL